jgi:predicted alpha/beta-fold hydrolase
MRTILALFLTILLLPTVSLAVEEAAYPIENPYKATVYGTPSGISYVFKKPVRPEVRAIRIEDRQTPEVFSYTRDMFFTTALQDAPAPLIFIIAGTGAEHNSSKMAFLTQVFYEAGFHVVALPSPTHMNFVVSASEHGVPGYVPFDVADLNRVMRWVKEEIEKECKITGYSLTGYSLGALHSAFLAQMDEEQKIFNFQKVLMINPPVSLYRSVTRLDSWLTSENLGQVTVHQQIEQFIDRFSEYYLKADVTDLDDEFLYEMITNMNLSERDLKTLIGAAFRVSSASMIFTSDVCLRAEYLVPPQDYPLKTSTPLMPYAQQAFNISFENYLDEYLVPFLQYMDPVQNHDTVVRQSSLEAIRPYLEQSDKIMVVGNRDDVILDQGDVRFLEEVFGDRAQLFPHGGHCGNLMYPAFVQAMVEKIGKGQP